MRYSTFTDKTEVYETDDYGNIIYDEAPDGEQIPRSTGEYQNNYTEPIEFKANIGSKLHEIWFRSYGIDKSDDHQELCCSKDSVQIKHGDVIWRKSEVLRRPDGTIDGSSADYIVIGVADEGLDIDLFLLQRVNNESKD